MDTYKIVIVDDEVNNIFILKHFVSKYCTNVEVVGHALSVADAIIEINGKQPNIVFLDARLNGKEAFEILDKVNNPNMQVIFVTAYDEYALKAFKYNATDYILKPIAIEEVLLAINKAIQNLNKQKYFDLNFYKKTHDVHDNKDYIAIASMDKIDLIKTEEIMYLEAESKYAVFNLKGGKKLVSNKNLIYYERCISNWDFFRVHNSYIINIKFVTRIIKKEGCYCELANGFLIPVARRKQEEFNRFLKVKD